MEVRAGAVGAAGGDGVAGRALTGEGALAAGDICSQQGGAEVKHGFGRAASRGGFGDLDAVMELRAHLFAEACSLFLAAVMAAFAGKHEAGQRRQAHHEQGSGEQGAHDLVETEFSHRGNPSNLFRY